MSASCASSSVMETVHAAHLPPERQEKIFKRRYGVEVPKQSMSRADARVADSFKLVIEEMTGGGSPPVRFKWTRRRSATCAPARGNVGQAACGPRMSLVESSGRHFDLSITEVIMPVMNGQDPSRELTRRFPDLKTLFISGFPADIVAKQGVLDPEIRFPHLPFIVLGLLEFISQPRVSMILRDWQCMRMDFLLGYIL